MSSQLVLALLLVILAVAVVLMYRLWRLAGSPWPWRKPRHAEPAQGTTEVMQGGVVVRRVSTEAPRQPGPTGSSEEHWSARLRRGFTPLMALLFIIPALLLLWLVPRLFYSPADQFVVLVAPFSDGGGGQGGRVSAEALVTAINTRGAGRVVARTTTAPADAKAAATQLRTTGADALIAGAIAPGGLIDQPVLQPTLYYQPTGGFAPKAWEGYTGRFALPLEYQLANAPINGQVVLPELVIALADYGDGHFDDAYNTLGSLIDSNPALAPTLPRMLRGNILWARGDYRSAADEYRRIPALTAAASTTALALRVGGADVAFQGSEPDDITVAQLANNLGAILQDAGSAQSRDAFNRSITLLGTQDLGELRLNLGLEQLRAGRPSEALEMLEQAERLLPGSTPLYLALARTYRGLGPAYTERAQRALDLASASARRDAEAVTPRLRLLTGRTAEIAVNAERGLQTLSRETGGSDSLLWNLQSRRVYDPDVLESAFKDLTQAANETASQVQAWREVAAAEEAANQPIAGLAASAMAQRLDAQRDERQQWADAAQLKMLELRSKGAVPTGRSWFTSVLGDNSPLAQLTNRLGVQRTTSSENIDLMLLLARARLASGAVNDAIRLYDAAFALDQSRPDALFGRGLALLPTDTAQARQSFNMAIALRGDFFPAREELADLAENQGNWAEAITQRRWLSQNRPSEANQVELGAALRRSGRAGYAEAEQVLLPLANARNVPALLELGRLYVDDEQFGPAETALRRAQQVDSSNAEVAFVLAGLLHRQGDLAGAEQQLRLAVYHNPNFTEAHLALAQLYDEQGKPAAAREYRAVLDNDTTDPAVLQKIGTELLSRGETAAAIRAYERAVKYAPQNATMQHELAQAYRKGQQLGKAEAAERQAINLKNGVYPEALVGLGDISLDREAPDQAVEYYNQAIAQDPQLTPAFLGLGRAAAAEGNWGVALTRFSRAAETDTNSAEAKLWLGEALVRQGNPELAQQAYEAALALKQDYPEALFGLAQVQLGRGQLGAALDVVDKALKQRPRYALALLLRGKIQEQRGEIDDAIRNYGEAISADRDLAEPYFRRALIAIQQERSASALVDLRAAIDRQKLYPEAHYWLGRALLISGRADEARQELVQAIEQRGNNYPEAQYFQGMAEERMGRYSDAIASYRAVTQQSDAGLWAGEANAAIARLGVP